jgi:leucyl aminopeptidase
VKWVHLDIAGPAMRQVKDIKGTGFGAQLLLRWLTKHSSQNFDENGNSGKE